MKKKIIVPIVGVLALIPTYTYAISASDLPVIRLLAPEDSVNPSSILTNIINFILEFAAGIAILMIIIGGIMYMVSGGNDDRVGKAKKLITNAVLGLIVIILAGIIVAFVSDFAKDAVS